MAATIITLAVLAVIVILGVATVIVKGEGRDKPYLAEQSRGLTSQTSTNRNAVTASTPVHYIKKSSAYWQGYLDMLHALDNHVYYNDPDRVDKSFKPSYWNYYVQDPTTHVVTVDKALWKNFAVNPDMVRSFQPSEGRTSERFMAGDRVTWEEYYAGGMKLLSDVDDAQVRIADEKRTIEIRKQGAKELDRRYIESKKALDSLRDRTFNGTTQMDEFNRQMLEAEASAPPLDKRRKRR